MNIKEIALKLQATDRFRLNVSELSAIEFAEAIIESYKAELLKEVGDPVAYYDPDLDCGSAGISFDPLSDGICLYTSDQVAAAILKATKPLEDQLAKAEQRMAEWQPIETAPKCSSTVILGFDPSWYDIATPMFWSEKKSNWRFYQIDEEIRPTHWMPLPKAPNGASS